MATSTTQAALDDPRVYVHDFERGDLLIDHGTGRSQKLLLSECPICAADPTRPRHHFGDGDSRPQHFRTRHDAGEI